MGRTRIIRLSEIDWTLLTSIDPAHIQFINSSISLKAAIKPGCASDVTRRNELLVGGRRADPLRMPASVPDAERPVSSPLRRMKSIMFQGAPARRSARGWWHPITGGTHCWRCIARRALSVHRSPGLLYCTCHVASPRYWSSTGEHSDGRTGLPCCQWTRHCTGDRRISVTPPRHSGRKTADIESLATRPLLVQSVTSVSLLKLAGMSTED